MPYEVLGAEAPTAVERELPSGRHMIFRLAGELYAVDILTIREIVGSMEPVRVPRTPAFIEGVINLRGRVVPILDLRRRLGLESGDDIERPCIMILQSEHGSAPLTVGVLVAESKLNVTTSPAETVKGTLSPPGTPPAP